MSSKEFAKTALINPAREKSVEVSKKIMKAMNRILTEITIKK